MNYTELRIEWLNDIVDIELLENKWVELERSVNKRTVHSSFDWVFPWYKHLSVKEEKSFGKPLLGTAWKGDKLCGVAPLVIRNTKIAKIPMREIDMVGYNCEAGEFLIPDDMPELVGDFIESIIEAVNFDIIQLNSFSRNSDQFYALSKVTDEFKLNIEFEDYFYALVNLESGYESYYKSRSSRYRRNLRNQEKKLSNEGGWKLEKFTELEHEAELQSALSRMVSIYNSSWKAIDGKSLPDTYQKFYEDISYRFAAKGMLDLSLLTVDSKDVAFFLALVDDGVLYDVFISYKNSFKSIRPGEFLMLQLLKNTPNHNIHTVVSHGAHDYKRVWASDFVPLTRVCIFSNGLKSNLARIISYKLKPMIHSFKKKIKFNH